MSMSETTTCREGGAQSSNLLGLDNGIRVLLCLLLLHRKQPFEEVIASRQSILHQSSNTIEVCCHGLQTFLQFSSSIELLRYDVTF